MLCVCGVARDPNRPAKRSIAIASRNISIYAHSPEFIQPREMKGEELVKMYFALADCYFSKKWLKCMLLSQILMQLYVPRNSKYARKQCVCVQGRTDNIIFHDLSNTLYVSSAIQYIRNTARERKIKEYIRKPVEDFTLLCHFVLFTVKYTVNAVNGKYHKRHFHWKYLKIRVQFGVGSLFRITMRPHYK